jgi:transcriptional regulator with XRE-family HTH domain
LQWSVAKGNVFIAYYKNSNYSVSIGVFDNIYVSLQAMSKILDQIKQRRKELGLTQAEMMLRIGMSRQQYQRLESKGNPRLDNLELLAKGLKMELMLIPQEQLQAVKALLDGKLVDNEKALSKVGTTETIESMGNPWDDLLADDR